MSDNENNNKDLKPGGESSPPTDQVSQTDAPAVDSETTDTSSAEEETNRLLLQTMTMMKVKVKKLKEEKSPIRKIRTTFPKQQKMSASL